MNKKELVNLIKKIAQGAQPPTRDNDLEGPPPPGTKPAAPANSGAVSGDPNIKAMQEALVNLSKAFTSQRTDLKPATGPTRKSFADYVSNSYLKDPNGGASPVLDSLKQLSDPKLGGFPIDGKWGPKTYNALHRVTDFASSLMKMVKQFRINVTSYSENDLNGFIGFIDGDKLTQKQKVDNAQEITKHINAISNLYSEVMKSVMSSPAMKEKIEGMPAEQNSALPPQVVAALNSKYNQFSIHFQGDAGTVQKPITVNDFSSKANLEDWKKNNLGPLPVTLSEIISQLKQQVAKMQ